MQEESHFFQVRGQARPHIMFLEGGDPLYPDIQSLGVTPFTTEGEEGGSGLVFCDGGGGEGRCGLAHCEKGVRRWIVDLPTVKKGLEGGLWTCPLL